MGRAAACCSTCRTAARPRMAPVILMIERFHALLPPKLFVVAALARIKASLCLPRVHQPAECSALAIATSGPLCLHRHTTCCARAPRAQGSVRIPSIAKVVPQELAKAQTLQQRNTTASGTIAATSAKSGKAPAMAGAGRLKPVGAGGERAADFIRMADSRPGDLGAVSAATSMQGQRTLQVFGPAPEDASSNSIRTSKYRWYNLVQLNLLEQ